MDVVRQKKLCFLLPNNPIYSPLLPRPFIFLWQFPEKIVLSVPPQFVYELVFLGQFVSFFSTGSEIAKKCLLHLLYLESHVAGPPPPKKKKYRNKSYTFTLFGKAV